MQYILLIACKDKKGLITKITGILFARKLNVTSNAEFVERETNSFFMRTCFSGEIDQAEIINEMALMLPPGAFIKLEPVKKRRILVLATKEHHCLGDLLIRNYSGELPGTICCVISNHENLHDLTNRFDIPFHHVPVEKLTREDHETALLNVIMEYNPEYLVLAKYMRILTPSLIRKFPNRIINIHHSFLPAFVGARPYEQAFRRGVKIIGATAHFVNENLDEGPIIAQNVMPVAHSHSAEEMAQAGKDVEKTVLAKALKLALEERIFVSGNKTIIFD